MSEPTPDAPRVSGAPVFGPQRDPIEALSRYAQKALSDGQAGTAVDATVSEMRHNRRVNSRRTAAAGSDMSFATGRPVLEAGFDRLAAFLNGQ